jgi:hypothetical protein
MHLLVTNLVYVFVRKFIYWILFSCNIMGQTGLEFFFNVGSRIDDFCNDIEGIAPKTIRVTCSGLVTYLVFQDLSILVLMCVCYLYHLYFVLNLSIHSFNRCISFSPPSNYYDGLFGTSSTSRMICYLCTS